MSILAPRLDGAVVLDLFAGSGALGLEAISRGAASAVFVERAGTGARPDPPQHRRARCRGPDPDRPRRRAALRGWSWVPAPTTSPFADPPYATDFAARLVAAFRRTPFAAILAVEHAASRPASRATTPVATATPPSRSATPHDAHRDLPGLVRSTHPGARGPDPPRARARRPRRSSRSPSTPPSSRSFDLADRGSPCCARSSAPIHGSRSPRSRDCWPTTPARPARPWWCADFAPPATSSTSCRWR